MSTQMPNPQRSDEDAQTIAAAISDVSEKAQLLVREEIELAKAEVTQKVNALKKGAIIGAAAGVFVLGALILLLHGFAWLLYNVIPIGGQFAYFWGFFIAAVILLVIAAVAGLLAYRAFKKGAPPTPELAIEEAKRIQETVQTAGKEGAA